MNSAWLSVCLSIAARPTGIKTAVRAQIGAVQLPLLSHAAASRATVGMLAGAPLVGMSSATFCSAAAPSASIAIGDRVSLRMNGKRENGEPFGQTSEQEPLSFIVGSGDIIPGIDEAVVGLVKGDSRSVEIPPEKAFGKEKQIFTVPRKQMNLPYVVTADVSFAYLSSA